MAERIQLKRTKGWRMPQGAVIVDRRTMWGNPFKPGQRLTAFPWRELADKVRDHAHAVELFESYARITSGYDVLVQEKLRGKDLACWCAIGDPCHADVLLEIANRRAF